MPTPKEMALELMIKSGIVNDREQVRACAPIVNTLKQMWDRRKPGSAFATGKPDKPHRALFLGQGGSGKTYTYTAVIKSLHEHFLDEAVRKWRDTGVVDTGHNVDLTQ